MHTANLGIWPRRFVLCLLGLATFGLGMSLPGLIGHPAAPSAGGSNVDGNSAAALPAWISPLGGGPLPFSKPTTLGLAARQVSFRLLRPQMKLASDQGVAKVWVTTAGTPQVAIEYASGILVLIKTVEFDDPIAKYKAIQREFGSSYVTRIGTAPAIVLTGNIPGRAPSIDMVIGKVNVQIQGQTGPFSVGDILRVARSISQRAPAQGQ